MKKRTVTIGWPRWRRIRQAVQILSFAFYVYLLFAALQQRVAFPPADLFFRLDLLAGLGAMSASRSWIPRLGLALTTLGLTVAVGRVWCGWLCPLGSLLEWIRLPRARRWATTISPRWRTLKYWFLFVILAAALFGNLTLLVVDPLALLTRTMTTAILPALNSAITTTERALYPVHALRPALDWVEALVRGPVLPVTQQVFGQNVSIAALFGGILALNVLADRFWCRYLCPLGALLGLVSKVTFLRPVIGAGCNRCGQCLDACRLDAIDARQGYEVMSDECTVCLDCVAACPEKGIGFRLHGHPDPWREYDPSRRQALTALATSVVGVLLLRTSVQARQHHPLLLRPPGAQEEHDFLARCLRCSQCMKVCPTQALQPTLVEAGWDGLWTPRLACRLGYCDYGCNACGQVCPSGAIPPLALADKRQAIIGLAAIDRNQCLPWAQGTPCIVCEEMCPTPEKAVRLEEVTVVNDRDESIVVQRPYVLQDRCIGCGICEYRCPVAGEAAIKVYRR